MLSALDKLVAVLLVAGLLFAAVLLGREAEKIVGPVRVIDGDTVEMSGRRIRLRGIDAPELAQSCERSGIRYGCGEVSRVVLVRLIGDKTIECTTSGRDQYGRDLARCSANGSDLGATMVERGLALSVRGYTAEEQAARARGLGLWAGTFQRPADWRAEHRH